jgi:hypothetical protein
MKRFSQNSVHLFAFLGMLFIPAATYLFTFQDKFAVWVFGNLINIFIPDHLDFTSDTLGLNILLLSLFVLSLVFAFVLQQTKFWKNKGDKIILLIQLLAIYYLASRLMVYGFDKVFKTQFYTPEPNTLFTPLGALSKDILFWSAMGTSKMYCFLSGIAEIIPAFLLLFRKSRVVGLILTTFILLHVLTLNIGFDISVKLYSIFLLYLTFISLSPYLKTLVLFFFRNELVTLPKSDTVFMNKIYLQRGIKFLVIGLILIEALKFPISTGYLSDDDVPRDPFHGAYEVVLITDGMNNFYMRDTFPVRFFVHRRNYLIFQFEDGRMEDYKLEIDREQEAFKITSYSNEVNYLQYELYENQTDLKLMYYIRGFGYQLHAVKKNLEYLPALQDEFHWTIDEFINEK